MDSMAVPKFMFHWKMTRSAQQVTTSFTCGAIFMPSQLCPGQFLAELRKQTKPEGLVTVFSHRTLVLPSVYH